ncbi:hypothetical protein Q5P01_024058 [Channa striata]|uniref:Uncharacterized protein n=1 Tax=Channa striata TaxID=64152 RepID=A0AA88IRM7_CHASR|nr:hypothetical protein Q5P01_024058 [Channa striata]
MLTAFGRMTVTMMVWVWIGLVAAARVNTAEESHRDANAGLVGLKAPGESWSGGGFFPVPVWKFLEVSGSGAAGSAEFSRPQYHCGDASLTVRFSLIQHSNLNLEDRSSLLERCHGSVRTLGQWRLLKLPYASCPMEIWVSDRMWLRQLTLRYFDHLLQDVMTGVATCKNPAESLTVPPLVSCGAAEVTVKLPPGSRLRRVKPLGKGGVAGVTLSSSTSDSVLVQILTLADTHTVLELISSDSAGQMSMMLVSCFNTGSQSGPGSHPRALENPLNTWEVLNLGSGLLAATGTSNPTLSQQVVNDDSVFYDLWGFYDIPAGPPRRNRNHNRPGINRNHNRGKSFNPAIYCCRKHNNRGKSFNVAIQCCRNHNRGLRNNNRRRSFNPAIYCHRKHNNRGKSFNVAIQCCRNHNRGLRNNNNRRKSFNPAIYCRRKHNRGHRNHNRRRSFNFAIYCCRKHNTAQHRSPQAQHRLPVPQPRKSFNLKIYCRRKHNRGRRNHNRRKSFNFAIYCRRKHNTGRCNHNSGCRNHNQRKRVNLAIYCRCKHNRGRCNHNRRKRFNFAIYCRRNHNTGRCNHNSGCRNHNQRKRVNLAIYCRCKHNRGRCNHNRRKSFNYAIYCRRNHNTGRRNHNSGCRNHNRRKRVNLAIYCRCKHNRGRCNHNRRKRFNFAIYCRRKHNS